MPMSELLIPNFYTGGPSGNPLQYISMPVVDHDYCIDQIRGFGITPPTEKQICSGETPDDNNGLGPCHVCSQMLLILCCIYFGKVDHSKLLSSKLENTLHVIFLSYTIFSIILRSLQPHNIDRRETKCQQRCCRVQWR